MKLCPHCDEPLLPGDDLVAINNDNQGIHRECLVRSVAGSVGHQLRRCQCFGIEDTSEAGMTRREAARAALAYIRDHLDTLRGVLRCERPEALHAGRVPESRAREGGPADEESAGFGAVAACYRNVSAAAFRAVAADRIRVGAAENARDRGSRLALN
jgi:hypothetical protein